MRFWKEHVALRVSLILILTVVGLGMVIGGWKMTGQMTGLIIMLVGLLQHAGRVQSRARPVLCAPQWGVGEKRIWTFY